MKRTLLLVFVFCAAATTTALAGQTRMIHIYNATPEELAVRTVRTYITADTGDEAEVEALRRRLIHAGARNVNWFGDNVIVCDVPGKLDLAPVLSSPGVVARSEADVPDYSPGNQDFVSQVKYAYGVAERLRQTPGLSAGVDFEERVNVISREEARRIREQIMENPAAAPSGPGEIARNTAQNSEILTGSIKIYMVFPESNGQIDPNRENWYEPDGSETQDLVDARTHAFAVFLDWQTQFPGMGISFRMIPLVPDCSYEPILHTMDDDGLWIMDVLTAMDPNLARYENSIAASHVWNEEHKGGYDWIYTMFIGHSRTVPNHRFGDGNAGYTAYANLGGPYLVNPYPAGVDINNIGENLVYSKIIQHESGHVFWTLDEYPGAPGSCASTSGYLNYANENVNMSGPGGITRCIPEIDCIMNQAARDPVGRPWCRWSLGHLGVIDDNDNAIPDVFEAPPIIAFETEGPDTVNVGDFTIRLTAISQAVPNRNTRFPAEERVDYAAPLKEVQFSVGGGWQTLPAADGNWDEMMETTSVRLNGLPPGALPVKFRARNSVGMYSPVYIKTVYFLGIRFAHLSVSPRADVNRISWDVVGENFGAAFNVYRLDASDAIPDLLAVRPGDEPPGTLVASDVQPTGTANNGFVPYAAVDADVTPGSRYSYYVIAVGEVEFLGETTPFYSPSKLVSQTAMVPVPSGRLVSYVSPNPFRNEVTLSIDVPQTFADGGSYQQRVATPVEVTVYDVMGRPVQTLHSGGSFEEVVTLKWNGMTSSGSAATSGVYFVRVKAGPALAVEKVLLVR